MQNGGPMYQRRVHKTVHSAVDWALVVTDDEFR